MPGLCPDHGPYDEMECPFCAVGRYGPPIPTPLEDDVPTDFRAAAMNRMGGAGQGDLPTDVGYNRGHQGRRNPDEGATEISANRAAQKRGPINYDDEEQTQLGRAHLDDHTEVEMAVTGTLGILWVSQGDRRGQIYHIKNGTVIGRKKGTLILDDPKVSDTHAKFTVEDDVFYLWDFGSTNGTFVNSERIRGATAIDESDEIKIGNMYFVLKVLPDPENVGRRSQDKNATKRITSPEKETKRPARSKS